MWPYPFEPLFGFTGPGGAEQSAPTVVAASTTTSAATLLPGNQGGDEANTVIRIENVTNGWAFCNFGDVNVGSATLNNGVGVPPNSFAIVSVRADTCYVTVILNTSATSGNVRFLRGNGIS
jgi:hypothetical protein